MEPWERNIDQLRESVWMNYSNIDPYWVAQGYNEENLPGIYTNFDLGKIVSKCISF